MNTLDTRDLYKRKCELEELRDAIPEIQERLTEYRKEMPENTRDDEERALEDELEDAQNAFGPDEEKELAELEEVETNVRGFMHGVELIEVEDFEQYAEQYARDTGDVRKNESWPFNCIDWEKAAEELSQDFSVLEFQGVSYYYRD